MADPDAARLSREIIRGSDFATLATVFEGQEGWPYASLVNVACDHRATPILLISELAEHTRNALADPRVSLLFDGTRSAEEPMNAPRVTMLGRVRKSDDDGHRARFLARNPAAALYADFGDFGFYTVEVERAHLVRGFGKVRWFEPDALLYETSGAGALAAAESEIVAHMNEDHADAVDLYARNLLGLAGEGWELTGVDPKGCDLRLEAQVARLAFGKPVADADAARAELVRLVKQARSRGAA